LLLSVFHTITPFLVEKVGLLFQLVLLWLYQLHNRYTMWGFLWRLQKKYDCI